MADQVPGHPAKTEAHQQGLLLGHEAREKEDPFAPEHVPIIAATAGVLDAQLDVGVEVFQARGAPEGGQGVLGADAEDAGDLRQRPGPEQGRGFVVLGEHQVRVVSLETKLDAVQELDLELDPGGDPLLGELLEGPQRVLQGQDAVDDHEQPRLPARGELARQRLHLVRLPQHLAPFQQDRLALGRELHPVAAPVEERQPELLFEPLHLVADRRGDLVELGGGPGKTAGAHHRVEGQQGVEVELHFQEFRTSLAKKFAFFEGASRSKNTVRGTLR